MRIAFLDGVHWDYRVESVSQIALGGTQSAVCYLAEAMTRSGHEVFLLNNTSISKTSCGVKCLSIHALPKNLLPTFDVLIEVNSAGLAAQLKPYLNGDARVVLWGHHAADQPAIQNLREPAVRGIYDGIVLLSQWQRQQYVLQLGIDPSRIVILPNAIGRPFCDLFEGQASILAHKIRPPVLAYTSTPFRGLEILLEAFPVIRNAFPGIRLKVFSSMKVYFVPEESDDYAPLYERCRRLEGVEYAGSIPQAKLAREMKPISIFAYPNTFPETSCISALEAMASGCRVVTSDWGALPETTAGYSRLVPVNGNWSLYKQRFVEATCEVLRELSVADLSQVENLVRDQVEYVNTGYRWETVAGRWSRWLTSLATKTNQDSIASS